MKKIYTYIHLAFVVLFVSSCVEDLGNYDYVSSSDVIPVKVSGLRDTTIITNTELQLIPIVENIDDENRYSYLWYSLPTTAQGYIPRRDTLSYAKELKVPIKFTAGSYSLYYEIHDKQKNVSVINKIILTVVESEIVSGWYILKDVNNETDFDYINADKKMYPDVLRTISGNNQLKGKAVKILYQGGAYYQEVKRPDGATQVLASQKVIHVLTTEDMKTFNANNIALFKTYEEQFYGLPQTCAPQACEFVPNSLYLLNGSKAYSITGDMPNVGKFGSSKVGPFGHYEMHKDMMTSFNVAMGFDTISHSFLTFTAGGTALAKLADKAGFISPTNMNVRLIDLLLGSANNLNPSSGYAVMQSLTNSNQYYVASIGLKDAATYPFTSFDTIPESCVMPKAPVKALPTMGSFIYYAYDNNLYVYKDAKGLAQRESLVRSFPANEKISFIKNFMKTKTGGYEYMYIAVLTNSPNGWKMYLFNLIGLSNPEIDPTPAHVFEGKGNARFIMFR